MGLLHELLAAEGARNAAWNAMLDETTKKFGKRATYFDGHSKSLAMIQETPENVAIAAAAREEVPVTTTVLETLRYALDLFAKAEDLQAQKGATNRVAAANVMLGGAVLLADVPVDELVGLEARLSRMRQMVLAIPTLDASKKWKPAPQQGAGIWEADPEITTKTEKKLEAVQMAAATDKHAAQVQAVTRDVVVGTFSTTHRSGAVTAQQKADMIKRIDELLVETKFARQRANAVPVIEAEVGAVLVEMILAPLQNTND